MTSLNRPMTSWLACPCGKRGWPSRKLARRAARVTDHTQSMAAYRCPQSGFWHVGHKPFVVARGQISRAEIYPRRPR